MAQTPGFVRWNLEANNQDNAAVRSGLTGAPSTFKRLVISDGLVPTNATAYAPYTAGLGQAFAVLSNGGGWSSNATPPGPGSAPRRTFYTQFQATATAATRLDSLILDASVASSAAGKIAVMYSLSNFVSDSASITAAKGPAISNSTVTQPGGLLPATANGTFGTGTGTSNAGAVLPQYATGGVPSTFRFALTNGAGLALASGQTLTVRLYFGVGSSSVGRYVFLRNVTLKSTQPALASKQAVAKQSLNVYPNPAQDFLAVAHPAAAKGATVAVYSSNGQKVASLAAQPNSTATEVRLSTLTAGIYLVEYNDGQQRITSKVVKQ
ncbi:T9SS type A sorting domain-containing protein [Hymenobacter chitinivorans]|uniref:Putative secreted protein (Por secretion system target) n=1 Tax=Hymenobacter chitinivorans DSM 11115 TaxID=1121954 RepID=A0A2M9BS87_9BACT|nr:T9SS type A sorting domain-containing protein [Hymenobacter chitinivorans]PJJ60805.1 putative secreted protein (Por secretion system target) [Hymenobacter chitinivorans DSM 11115]